MYQNLLFHVRNYFPFKANINSHVLLRSVCIFTFLSFFNDFHVNAQNISFAQSITDHEKKTITAPLTHLITGNINGNKTNKLIMFCSIIGLSVITFLTYQIKTHQNIFAKYVRNLLQKNKNENNVLLKTVLETEINKTPVKSLHAISTETYNTILKKLSKFERSEKYLRKDINLTWLSNHLNTNTKYLSEVIKTHTEKNFSSYINGLRIRYIIKKLDEIPVYRDYKISYLAEECGYASSQVFAIAFKKETGVTPSYFIEQLKNDTTQNPDKFSA
ncbi:helix-turn-helix transcriptional regulator [Chryseobacterium sp. RG1]|uniref:Helix-turn-helix transcriptional regulator n=1 Tax=Chryseobacterium tagetis TaxID=2801334 RepID=A0ABS7ZXP6_9FLAO|nr:helix-turn-helix transcriptional regulator [Chryseobacterium tagetis]MCA6065988.1 helix-turn-helix transcriptional regulator [Chryseobacterium tagetis]